MTPATVEVTRAMPALAFESFGFTYPGASEPALREVTLRVEQGEFVLCVGRSGSGKSTLLRAATGLVPHHFGGVAAGEAAVCGYDLRATTTARLAAVCGTVLQDPEVQIVMGSVRGEIAFPLENLGWSGREVAVAVEETALALGIHELLDRRTGELSGGELQRVVLAAAIAAGQPLVVLDEPTSQLDPVAADELIAGLVRLNGDRGATVLLADHRIERCIDVADRVIVFERGAIALDAPPAEFLAWAAASPARDWLLTPAAKMFSLAGIDPLPVGAKQARRQLAEFAPPPARAIASDSARPPAASAAPAIELARVGYAYPEAAGPALEGVSAVFAPGEATVLMGANGSGKSTLLRLMRGLHKPTSGSVKSAGDVALLLQNPNDYLIHETVAAEAPAASLARFGLAGKAACDPRELSGGERQRLALAIVMQHEPVALLLDEPTRGMDREHKIDLAAMLRRLTGDGVAVVVATHDLEFAAEFATRALLLGNGRVLADDDARAVLTRGWHFSTEVARLFPGSGALTARDGAALLAGGGAG